MTHYRVVTSYWIADVYVDNWTHRVRDTSPCLNRFINVLYTRLVNWVRSLKTFQRIELLEVL